MFLPNINEWISSLRVCLFGGEIKWMENFFKYVWLDKEKGK